MSIFSSILSILSSRQRPVHKGKYPMEKIKRVDQPTTKITDEVPRIPKRANFFQRAGLDISPSKC